MQRFQFHPAVARWFEETFGSPTEPQERGWPAIQSGGHTLIAAPTGSGKTLAAFLASLDRLFRDGLEGKLRDETSVLYVSPLKALSNDIHKNLEQPLAGIRAALLAAEGHSIEVRAAVRTGDTPSSARQAILRKPPHILVTTPESFYLLLTSLSGRRLLTTIRTLIIDEIHAVVGNRRGSHLALSMERLAALVSGPLQRIGLSATQKPIEEVARFLVGENPAAGNELASQPIASRRISGKATEPLDDAAVRCAIIDAGLRRDFDLAIELPASPLEAVMSNEVWEEVYGKLAGFIEAHRTTLVFVNTRRLAERVTHQLAGRLGKDRVTSHHGSLSAKLRLDAENRLKRGELKALVATASLELGIDIGSVDLVCQLGPTRSIATLLQRVGRAEHRRGGLPKGRLFPLTRDELVECLATLRSIRRGDLDTLHIPEKPLDVLAQQMVAWAACEDCDEEQLCERLRGAYPYRGLTRADFDAVLRMLTEGFSTKRGRRGALLHHDGVNHRVRARRGARLVALTSGGAIPDNADYRVVLHPADTFIGTVNEDFAIESMAGDIFQLGNASWKILQIQSGVVRVEDAHGQPPGIPFWLGEAPGRTRELSEAVSQLRTEVEQRIEMALGRDTATALADWLTTETGLCEAGARQLADYFVASYQALGVIPSQRKIVLERFFDESGGMQLVIHSPFGSRLNRAWGLALRKRFCRSFNFELQAAATDDAIVLSLGTQHSFPLEEVFHYLNSRSVRDLLVQALLDAPMFPVRWRWNASRALALPRQRGGRKVPPPLQRMEAENLIAAVFPDQLACLENIAGDREVPDHPLVRQTIDDCLTEAMDIDGLEELLRRIERGEVQCVARDLPEPSPLALEVLNAKPYAFLDNAPLEERRTQAVYTRRISRAEEGSKLGLLDGAAIERVCDEAWPCTATADELHEALLQLGVVSDQEATRCAPRASEFLASLKTEKRAAQFQDGSSFWVAAERLPMIRAVYPDCPLEPPLEPPEAERRRSWERPEALRELIRGRMEVCGPVAADTLASLLRLPRTDVDAALLALEVEGFVLRGKYHPNAIDVEWCDRRLLARIHRLTIHQLRAAIQPVSIADFQRFLLAWHRLSPGHQAEGPEGVRAVLELLDGCELSAAAWEPEVLSMRVKDYAPQWLDQLCFTGRIGWGRLTPPGHAKGRAFGPLRSSPMSLFARDNLPHWLALSSKPSTTGFSPDTQSVRDALSEAGALFFAEIVRRVELLPSRVEQALGELSMQGWVTADSFEGLRAMLVPPEKRAPFADLARKRRYQAVASIEHAGRWALLRTPGADARQLTAAAERAGGEVTSATSRRSAAQAREEAIEILARALLRRYGVMFRRLLERESLGASWFELGRVYRQLEARGEIRGGHFIDGVSGEQFALPEAIGLLRSIRKAQVGSEDLVTISAADPLNLVGVLTSGARIPAIATNRILLHGGIPIAALEAGRVIRLDHQCEIPERIVDQALKIGTLPALLRPYYG
jgi:ATP-dependent Lhr-like helicase